jgi:RNA polymerase sigma factor (sigma-70 family)
MQFIRYHEVDPLLVERAQAGDKKATNELIVQLLPLVEKMANNQYYGKLNRRTASMISKEDLSQEGALAIYTALKSFDKSRNDKFHMYVQYIISRKMSDFMKSYVEKNKDYVATSKQSVLVDDLEQSCYTLEDRYIIIRNMKDELKILEELKCIDTETDPFIKKRIRRATRRLKRDEYKMLKRILLKEESYVDIGEKQINKVSRQAVHQKWTRVLKKLQEELKDLLD